MSKQCEDLIALPAWILYIYRPLIRRLPIWLCEVKSLYRRRRAVWGVCGRGKSATPNIFYSATMGGTNSHRDLMPRYDITTIPWSKYPRWRKKNVHVVFSRPFSSWSVDISFKDDVTVHFLGISFITTMRGGGTFLFIKQNTERKQYMYCMVKGVEWRSVSAYYCVIFWYTAGSYTCKRKHRGRRLEVWSYGSAPRPPPPPPPNGRLSLFLSLPVCRRSSLPMGEGAGWAVG